MVRRNCWPPCILQWFLLKCFHRCEYSFRQRTALLYNCLNIYCLNISPSFCPFSWNINTRYHAFWHYNGGKLVSLLNLYSTLTNRIIDQKKRAVVCMHSSESSTTNVLITCCVGLVGYKLGHIDVELTFKDMAEGTPWSFIIDFVRMSSSRIRQ